MKEKTYLDNLKDFEKFEAYTDEGQKVRCKKEPASEGGESTFFVYAKGKRRYGYRYSKEAFLSLYKPLVVTDEDKTAKWHKEIRRALKEMDKSGFWKGSDVEKRLRNLLKITLKDKEAIEEIYWQAPQEGGKRVLDRALIRPYMARYPFLFLVGENGALTSQPDFSYFSDLMACKLKSMYFGKGSRAKEEIREAAQQGRNLSRRDYTSYDVSFELKQPDESCSFVRAWYSEEFRGCGNGHYYLALSENTALFVEDD